MPDRDSTVATEDDARIEALLDGFDFESLAGKYKEARWRWGGSYSGRSGYIPNAKQIREAARELLVHTLKVSTGDSVSSGGLYARYDGKDFFLTADHELGGTGLWKDTDGD